MCATPEHLGDVSHIGTIHIDTNFTFMLLLVIQIANGKVDGCRRYLEVPDEVRSGVVTVELVVEKLPVGFALDSLTMLAQNDQLLLR